MPIFRMEVRYRQANRFIWLKPTRLSDQLNLRRLKWITLQIQFAKVETTFIRRILEIEHNEVPFKQILRIRGSNEIVVQSPIVLSHLFFVILQKHTILFLNSIYTRLVFSFHFYYYKRQYSIFNSIRNHIYSIHLPC